MKERSKQTERFLLGSQNWIETMAAYVKSLDPYHLISVGSEGFYGINDKTRSDYANPQGSDT